MMNIVLNPIGTAGAYDYLSPTYSWISVEESMRVLGQIAKVAKAIQPKMKEKNKRPTSEKKKKTSKLDKLDIKVINKLLLWISEKEQYISKSEDLISENYPIKKKTLEIAPHTDASVIKSELQRICNISDEKVMKIRNKDGDLVPISFLADPSITETDFSIDVALVSYVDKKNANLLQDAYVDAVHQKINSLECRITQSELLLPQLEWRRQAYMEDAVNGLFNKVAFLNRRFDELLPQITDKHPETIA